MSKRLTTEEFIERARKVHGDRYDYSNVVYVDTYTKIDITCRIHGVFSQTPKQHMKGRNCWNCAAKNISRSKRNKVGKIIQKAKEAHGERYDYSKVIYRGLKEKIEIICPQHGIFWQLPGDHIHGHKCIDCGYEERETRYYGKDKFIEIANDVHGNKYDYSTVDYKKSILKVKIICPIHGEFDQRPDHHMRGGGCWDCGIEKRGLSQRTSQKDFIAKSIEIHGDFYDYSNVEYNGNKEHVRIICPTHGGFNQSPAEHYKRGCLECGRPFRKTRRLSQEEFISRANEIHNNKYNYSNAIYNLDGGYVSIICPQHGSFDQTGGAHLQGQGCPICKGSNGEKIINKFLRKHELIFTSQKTFPDCKDIAVLKFDFAIYAAPFTIIEYQGIQHYEAIEFFGGKQGFIDRQRRDQIKRDYCKKKGYRLIEIPYWDYDNINQILHKELDCLESLPEPTFEPLKEAPQLGFYEQGKLFNNDK